MHLKKIDIQGFKSFANQTTISFVSGSFRRSGAIGITAIVGPNGSGKSNISDAIRWVMGEQSMKNLRGKKSEDVIFLGTDKRGRMSTARVALVFDNNDKKLPVEYDEVVIERKMNRGGEGEYRINGARVRLMDVVDILAQAGLGRESHAVIGQGMTDAILGATPIERRLMIEDAAGVKHFQIRKQRAQKKIERTKENIIRTHDLIAEVEPHLKMLKRQAQKAQKSKAVFDELKSLQRIYFAFVWHGFDSEKKDLDKRCTDANVHLEICVTEVEALNEKIAIEAKKVELADVVIEYEEEKKNLYEKLRNIDRTIATAQGRIEVLQERRISELKTKSVPVDLGYIRERLEDLQKKHTVLFKELEVVETMDSLKGIRKRFESIQNDLRSLYDDAGKTSVALPQEANKEKILALDTKIVHFEKEAKSHEKEHKSIQENIIRLNTKISEEVSQDKQAREQFFVFEKQLRGKQEELDRARDVLNGHKVEIARIEVRAEDLVAEAQQDLGIAITELPYDGVNINVQEVDLQINKLRREYERIGGIDPLIVEEYQETQERFDFLTIESKDLEDALTQLKEVIKEMDKKINVAFIKAYKEIDVEFTKYFRILFDGGNAKLAKVQIDTAPRKKDEDDTAENFGSEAHVKNTPSKTETGIEVIASPPGKKIKHLSLLSGGERSLTSIAMLFAIIAYNPPPFTVLDEVEAALDEANSRRLARIFKELSTQTQFIIISHNRETMRHADMLYGVTMAQDGASQILSVKLDQIGEDGAVAPNEEK